MKKYPSIHGGATYVLPIMLSSDGDGIEGDVVATYRVGTETTSRNFTIEDVGTVPDPRAPATAEVYRYDCVIDAETTAELGPDAMITLDIDVTISGRVYHVVGAVVNYYAYGGEVENTPQGAHVVLNVAPIVTIVTVLAGNGGGAIITTADITDMTAAGVALATAADAAAQRFALGAVGYDELPPIEENAGVFVFGTSDVELKPLDNSGLNRAGRTMTIGPGASTGNGAPKSVSITAGQQGASGTAVREPLEVANFKLSAPEFYRPLLLTNRTEGQEEPISTTLVVPENAIAIDTATGKLLTLISGVWTDVSAAHTHLLADGASDVTVTAANLNTLDDGANTTLHFHDSDRARSNHTGTQLLSTISDVTAAGAAVARAVSPAAQRAALELAAVAQSGAYGDLTGRPTLGTSAARDVGTTAGTVAAGDDSRFGGQPSQVITLRASGTITVPSWAVTYKCEIWGQGGASGSGRKGATGTVCCGGGSGSAGAYASIEGAAADLGGSVVCVVPAAPAGGAAVTTDDTNGNPGAARTNTSAQLGGFLFVVQGGAPGAGGTNAGAAAGGVVTALALPALSVAGTVGAAASGSGSTGASGGNTNFGNGSGGAGGGITAANAASSGGTGGNSVMFGTTFTGGSAGGAGVAGTAGTVATGFHGSGGGGGGGGALTGAAGYGANGVGYGGGSGGGGAARNGVGNSSGKGGDGTAGTVRMTFYP